MGFNAQKVIIFRITHMLFVDLNYYFSCKENYNLSQKKFDNVRFCVRPLCELQLFAALDGNDKYHHPHLELWYRHGDRSTSPRFSKGRITASKEVKSIISRGMWRASVIPMGRLSVLSTCSHIHVVFLIVFSLQPLTELLHNKRSNSCHEKVSLKSTNNICGNPGHIKTGSRK